MFVTQPGPERWRLGFAEAVKASFAFVENYGLTLIQEEVTLVRYRSDRVILTVYHGRSSYEIGIQFARVESSGDAFSLYEVAKWAKNGRIEEMPTVGCQTSSRDGVQKFVPQLAETVRQYGEPLLRGDDTAYRAIGEQRSRDATEYTREVHLGAIRRKAETAWQKKDYEELIGLYGGVKDFLTKSELMKLHYAEKQLLLVKGSRTPKR
jgi:hypothetical protein